MGEVHNHYDQTEAKGGKYLNKIRALLAKAEGTDNEAERETLNAKAAEMAAKYGINAAQAGSTRPGADEMVIKEYEIAEMYATQHGRLLHRIMKALGSQTIWIGEDVHVVGYLADIEAGDVLYTSLSLQMASGAVREVPDGSYNTRKRRGDWMLGFGDTVGQRIEEARKRATKEADSSGTGVALVLQSREVAVKKAFDGEYPNRSHTRGALVDPGAYGAGSAAGRRADIGGARVGANGPAALVG